MNNISVLNNNSNFPIIANNSFATSTSSSQQLLQSNQVHQQQQSNTILFSSLLDKIISNGSQVMVSKIGNQMQLTPATPPPAPPRVIQSTNSHQLPQQQLTTQNTSASHHQVILSSSQISATPKIQNGPQFFVQTGAHHVPKLTGDQKAIQFVGSASCRISLDSSYYDTKTAKALGITVLPENAIILAQRYLIISQISGSSFYNCVDIKTGESLTCKAIGNSYAKIVSAYFKLDGSKYIKPLHKLLKSKDQTYLLLPPSQYGDLHSFVRERKRLREPEARNLFRQICKAVKECHQQGIVLRDLKLRKFVFSNKERTQIKFESLEDAVVLEDPDDDVLKEKIGCPAYVAPEILKPNSDFSGKAADLWSMGVILYTMLVGRYPFNDPEHSSLFAKIARCSFVIPEFVSPKAKCLIRSLLQRVPSNRIVTEDILDHPWFKMDETTRRIGGSIEAFALEKATNSYELQADDQKVPELDFMTFT